MKKILLALFSLFIIFNSAPVALAATSSSSQTDITVKSIQGPTEPQRLKSRSSVTWPWYITRAAGIIAVVLLILLILSGIGQITGFTFRFLEPLNAWAVHRAIGIAFGFRVRGSIK